MASTGSYLFATTVSNADGTYTDSGGSTAYVSFVLKPGVAGAVGGVTTGFLLSTGIAGAAGSILLYSQASTAVFIAFVTEQLAGVTYSSSQYVPNAWVKESAGTANLSFVHRMELLSSASTWISRIGISSTNLANEMPSSALAVVFVPNVFASSGITISSGQRLAWIVLATSGGGAPGGSAQFAWGTNTAAAIGHSYVIGDPIGYSTLAGAAVPAPIPNYQPRVITQAVNRGASFSWRLPTLNPEPE